MGVETCSRRCCAFETMALQAGFCTMLGTGSIQMIPLCWHLSETAPTVANDNYRYAPHNDVSVNDGPHI